MKLNSDNSLTRMILMVGMIMLISITLLSITASAQIVLTNPENNYSTLVVAQFTTVTFNFNTSVWNASLGSYDAETFEFTQSIATSNNMACDLMINGTVYSNVTSGFITDLSLGDYNWNVNCTSYNATYNATNITNSTNNSVSEIGIVQSFHLTAIGLNLTASATPNIGMAPFTVMFSADGNGGLPQYYYLWNFGDGGVFATYQNISYTYQNNGTFNATVQVRDSLNQIVSKSFLINVTKPKNFSSSVSMDKSEYVIGENSHISINAPLNTTVQLRFFKNEVQVDSMDFLHDVANSDYIYLLYPPYPISTAGNYTMKAYLTYDSVTNNHSVDFKLKTLDVVLPLTGAIVVDSTNIDSGRDVSFKSSVSGGIPPYSYEWDTNNDGTIDSTTVDTIARFGIGNFTVKLTVRDSNNTQMLKTIIMNSKEATYRVVVTVADARTNSILQNADVTFAGTLKNTGSGSGVEYSLKGGNYSLKVVKQDYFNYEQSFELKNDLALTIRLNSTNPYASDALTLNILNPDGSVSSAGSVGSAGTSFSVKYRVTGINPECTLFIKENGWWASKEKQAGAGDKNFNIDLDPGNYDYKVECSENGTTIGSQSYSIKISPDAVQQNSDDSDSSSQTSATSDNPDIQQLLDWILESKERFDSLDVKEKDAVDSMRLIKLLDDQKSEVDRIARDMADLKYLTGTTSQIDERRRDLDSRLRTIKGLIPKEVSVIDSSEFVKYPTAQDVNNLLSELKRLNDSDSVDATLKLQSKISVLTKMKKVTVNYYYLDPKTFIIVDKEITKKNSIENYSFVESIPKSLAKSTKDITFQNAYSLLKEDPIVEINLDDGDNDNNGNNNEKNGKITYFFQSSAELSQGENIMSILLEKNNLGRKKSGLFMGTGFSISKLLPVKISDSTLFIEIFAIVALLIAYVAYSYGDELKNMIGLSGQSGHDGKNTNYMRKLIGETMDNIERWNVEKAYMNYEEIKLLYKSLSPTDKGIVFDEISKIAAEINTKHALKLIDEAFDLIRAGEKEKATSHYNDVQAIYNSLPENFKERIHEKSLHLYTAIAA